MTDIDEAARHWDAVYGTKQPETTSWFQRRPQLSLRLLDATDDPPASVIDIGAGRSALARALLEAGCRDVTVLDVSTHALGAVALELSRHQEALTTVAADVLSWTPTRTYQAWHDRAVFHFLVAPADRVRYAATATAAVAPLGRLVLGTFAPDGPTHCSGLPTARYRAPDLAAHFAPDFTLEHHESEQHTTPNGAVQPFTWVVLRRRQRQAGLRSGHGGEDRVADHGEHPVGHQFGALGLTHTDPPRGAHAALRHQHGEPPGRGLSALP